MFILYRRVLTRRQEYRIWFTVSPGTINNAMPISFSYHTQYRTNFITAKKNQTQRPINTGSLMHRTFALLSYLHQLPLLSASYVRHSI
jgi:hypothetical protein